VPAYYLVTCLRNILYDIGVKKSKSFDFPLICVGNLSVGGTGKTPMIEYLIQLLKDEFTVATLSRGYKRKSKGFQIGKESVTAEILGDEPFQFYSKFKNDIKVAVDSDRVNGINSLLGLKNKPQIILLDDAFQHRKVKAGFNILLTTFDNLYTEDYLLPAGNLRESISGAKRADAIVITKCPNGLNEIEKDSIIKKIKPKKYQAIFFSSIQYSDSVKSIKEELKVSAINDFALVTGIANAKPLVEYLKNKNLKFEHLNYQDHYNFSTSDIEKLCKLKMVITTEKDFVRLQSFKALQDKLFYLPIKVQIDESEKFNSLIKQFINSKL
jgi:tetraacyldisaccharide 4'-kinase